VSAAWWFTVGALSMFGLMVGGAMAWMIREDTRLRRKWREECRKRGCEVV
jgi:hypothetical protein